MVTEWGMSDILGPLSYGQSSQEVFLGHSVTQQKNLSESTAQLIDQEVKRIVDECYAVAEKILKKNKKQLDLIAISLLEYETLSGEEIKILLSGGKLDRIQDVFEKDQREETSTLDLTKRFKKESDTLEPTPEPGI